MTMLPEDMELAADFPQGKRAEILWRVRELIREAAKADGFHEVGCGIGCGGENSFGSADVGLKLDGHQIEIRIDLPKPRQ